MENKWNHLFICEAQVTNIPFLRGKNTVRIRMHRQRRVLGRVKLELNVYMQAVGERSVSRLYTVTLLI